MLGTCKLAAALVFLMPGYRLLKEWAYAGIVILFMGGFASHLLVGDGPGQFIWSFLFGMLAIGSWVLRPATRVVKAFNTVAQETYSHPVNFLCAQRVVGLLCGDDQAAKATVAQLAAEAGLTPLDGGPLCLAKSLESFADLVRYLMIDGGQGVYLTIG